MKTERTSLSEHHQNTEIAIAWATRMKALLTLPDRNFGGLEYDSFDLADAHYKTLLRKQFKD